MHRLKQYIKGDGLGALLIKASIGSAGLRVVSLVFSLLVGILLARALGPSGYGVYALVIAITALLRVPTEFGLPSLVTREVAAARTMQNWGIIRGILRWANTVVAILSLSLLIIIGIWLFFGEDGGDTLFSRTFLWGLLLIPFVALGNLCGATLRAFEQIIHGQLQELVIRPGIFVLLLVIIVWLTGSSIDAANAMALSVIAAAIAFIAGIIMLLKVIPAKCRHAIPVTEPRKWTVSAFPMALTEGTRYLQGNLAVLLLGWLATQADVGLYRVADSTQLLVALPISLLNIVVQPFIARLHAEGDQIRLNKLVAYTAVGMFLGALGIFLVFAVFGEYLLSYFFGSEFEAAYTALLIIGAGHLISAFFGPNANLLNMTHHERAVTRAFAISLVTSIGLGVVLIPLFGIIGAATASSAGLFTWNIIMWLYSFRVLNINTSVVAFKKYL